jgi:hypothetical protein
LSSCLPTAQELVALDSSWQPGPLLPVPNDPDYSVCLVQVKPLFCDQYIDLG